MRVPDGRPRERIGRTGPERPSFGRDDLKIAIIGLAYFVAHQIAFFFPDTEKVLMAVWPPGGIGLAALLLSPRPLWLPILATLLVAGNAANLLSLKDPIASLGFMTANVLESLLSAWLISRVSPGPVKLNRVRALMTLIAAATVVNMCTGCIGAGIATFRAGASFWNSWFTWWVAHALGILLVAPLVVSWLSPEDSPPASRWRWAVELGAFMALWCVAAGLTFRWIRVPQPFGALPFMLIALLTWPVFRLGLRGVTLALTVLAGITIVSPAVATGPLLWGGVNAEERLLLAQLFLAFFAAIGMMITAAHAEASNAVRSSREDQIRVRALADNLPNGMVFQLIQEPDGTRRFVYVSAGVERVNGVRAEDALSDPWTLHSLIVEGDRARVAAAEGASARDMSVFNVVARLRRPDGQLRWMHIASAPRRLADGGILWDGIQIDITEQKQAEEDQRASRALLQSIADSTPDAVYAKDELGRYVFANRATSEFLGKPVEQILGRDDTALFPALEGATVMEGDCRVMSGRATQTYEERVTTADGVSRVFLSTKGPLLDNQGKAIGLYGIARDITARNRREEALRDAERGLRLAVEGAELGTWTAEPDTNSFQASDRAKEVHGLPPEAELDNQRVLAVVHPEDRARVVAQVERTFQTGEVFASEHRLLVSGGVVRWVSSRAQLFIDAGTRKLHGIVFDVTERKRAEKERDHLQAQLLQAQKMESVGRLAGGVAHDFNNMLGVILGNAELALGQVDPAQPLHADLEEIQKAAQRSSELTRRLLAFARKQTVAPKVLDLNATVPGMLKMLRRLIGEDIDLAWKPGRELWPVRIDPAQIDQILANLAVNSRDAIGGVGKLTIETGNAVLDESYCVDHAGAVPGEYVVLAISDDGRGMGKEVLEHLFEPFFTTKDVGQGTGLGLATVYGSVKQNKGYIDVQSEPGLGTTFKIYLPRFVGKDSQPAAVIAGKTPSCRGETVLMVEDEPAVLSLGKTLLVQLGYTVLTAEKPSEAIRRAETHDGKIHLLITDVVMPEMNGRELAERIGLIRPGIKRLFMSGYTAEAIGASGVLDEGVSFLQKPFSVRDFAAKVQNALGWAGRE